MAKYDPNKDYSTLLANPNLTPAQREQYTQERQAKIQDMYGGAEPTYGNTGATFSSQYGASGARPTTYFNVADPQTQQTGYIINGTTYSDPYGNNRVSTGSVVNTDSGRYIKTDSGSMRYDDYLAGLNQQLQKENQKLQTQQFTMDDVRALMDSYSSPAYTPSAWDETREELAKAALAMNYNDWTNSDQYRALANRYGHQGQLTMQDVLGQVASRTGGLASSWAQTAAQQQYNEYMAQLEEAARSAYNTERGNAIENAQLAYNFSDNDYGRYLDQLAQDNNNRSFAFDVLSRALEQSNYNNEWANALERQRIEDSRYDDETAYNRALQQAETLAAVGDFSGYRDLGYTDAQIESLRRQYAADQLAAAAGYRGTGGGGEKETTYKPTLTVSQVDSAIEKGNLSPNVLAAYEYYYGAPYGGAEQNSYNETTSYADSVTAKNLASIDYDQDEGVITWNGKRYSDINRFRNDVNTAYASGRIDVATVQKLLNAANAYGLTFN